MDINFNTKWSTGNDIRDSGEVGQLSINHNTIKFHMNKINNITAKNFVGKYKLNNYKVFTHGPVELDPTGCFYKVLKVFQYIGDYKNFDDNYITQIAGCSFEIPELGNWLNIKSVDTNFSTDNSIIISEISTPIILLKESNPRIYIEYKSDDTFVAQTNINQRSIKKIPRVNITFSNLVNDQKAVEAITIIMRFFAILIGKTTYVENILLGLDETDAKMHLFLNNDFSVHYKWNAYCPSGRYKYDDVKEKLQQYFEQWYEFCCDESYRILLDSYFQICSQKPFSVEDTFLTYCRFMEGYSLRKSEDEKLALNLEQEILPILKTQEFKKSLSPIFDKVSSKYKPKEVAKWISIGFLGRVGLNTRIQKLDETHFSIIKENVNNFCNDIFVDDIYGKISKTRNYYAHYKSDKSDILEVNEMCRSLMVMEMLILSILMTEIGLDTETRKKAFIQDEVFGLYALHLCADEQAAHIT